jgi:DNA-binding MarR family transcriptional regulator
MAEQELFARLVADIFHAAGELRRTGEAIAGQAGQTQARWQLLSVLSEGDWTVPNVARRLGTTRQGVQRVADDVVDAGLAVYEDNPHHRRSPFLRLTAEGRRIYAEIGEISERRNRKFLSQFSDKEFIVAQTLLRRIIAMLQDADLEKAK